MDKQDRLCCLTLDEMEITRAVEYDSGSRQVLGDVTLPGHNGPASHALVVMLGGKQYVHVFMILFFFSCK